MSNAVFLLVLALIVPVVVSMAVMARADRRKQLVAALRAMGGSDVRTGWGHASATVQGVAVRLEMRIGDRHAPPTTVCSAALADPPRFEVHLRPQTRDELSEVRAGRAIDVVVGDRAFDHRFIIEAAPAEHARALLDEPTRAALSAFEPPPVVSVAGQHVRVQVAGRPGDAAARDIASLVITIARRVAEVPHVLAERHLAEAQRHPAQGYRGPTPEDARSSSESAHGELALARLRVARRRGTMRRVALAAAGLAVLLAFYLIPVALGQCGKPR
jgi:hypothetical protein